MLERILRLMNPVRIGALLALVVLVLYWPAIHHGFIDVDDPGFIVKNALVASKNVAAAFGSITMLLYIPVTIVSWQLNAMMGGLDPSVFHMTDIALHALNAILVGLLVLRLTKKRLAAILCALLFAVHPIHTEAVLWASSRKDVLSSTFALLSCLSYLQYLATNRDGKRYLSVLWYTLGLLSKIGIFPLPLAFLILDRLDGRTDMRTLWREKILYAVVAVPLIIVGLRAGNQFALGLSLWETLLVAAKGTTFLLWQLLWPVHLSIFHLQVAPITIGDPLFALSLPVFVALWLGLAILWKKQILLPTFGLAFFLLLLAPTYLAAQKAGLVFVTSDKYAYLPSVGLLVCIAVCFAWLEEHWKALLLPVTILTLFVAALLAVRTRSILPEWQDAISLENAVIAKEPGNAVALGNRGLLLENDGKLDDALTYLENAIAADPHYAIPYFNAAGVLEKLNRHEDAVALYAKLIPMLTAREVLGDRNMPKILSWLHGKFLEFGRPDLAVELQARLEQIAPAVAAQM